MSLLIGVALLAGCGEQPEASTALPTRSESSTPTSEALPPVGPADFPVPAEARTQDAAGAEAFLTYWIDLLNRQQAMPAGEPIRDLGPDCQECLRIARVLDEAAAAGHRYEGGELTLNDAAPPVLEAGEARLIFGARQEAVRLLDSSGTDVESALPMAPNLGSGLTLRWSDPDQSWLVAGFTLG